MSQVWYISYLIILKCNLGYKPGLYVGHYDPSGGKPLGHFKLVVCRNRFVKPARFWTISRQYIYLDCAIGIMLLWIIGLYYSNSQTWLNFHYDIEWIRFSSDYIILNSQHGWIFMVINNRYYWVFKVALAQWLLFYQMIWFILQWKE